MKSKFWRFACALGLILGTSVELTAQQAEFPINAAQVENGKATYANSCSQCHGNEQIAGQHAPSLFSVTFLQHWAGRPVNELLSMLRQQMPPGNAGSLSDNSYIEIIAYIFATHGAEIGLIPLPVSSSFVLPGKRLVEKIAAGTQELSPYATLPPWPITQRALDTFTRVTEALLQDPPEGSWLSWRRTRDAAGFSPLLQINKNNIQHLRAVWTLGLPAGSTQATPLVHDGVMFVYGFGDKLLALDAATGDELWRYSRKLPPGRGATVHRNIALYEDKVYIPTSDAYLVALDAKTGKVAWEQDLSNSSRDSTTKGFATAGPLIAQGVVMQGLTFWPHGGGVVGFDAATGQFLWRFHSIAQPGDPNDSSWNGIAPEKRSGGSVWAAGSYDAKHQLAFFGPAPTYDTAPLRDATNQLGVTNEALYTDTTVALRPKTGELVWYYQHLPNDQWDLDWAFERHVIQLKVHDKLKDLVITAGKLAIYDALETQTGRYVFSIDLGLQNLVTSIDQTTGAKSVDARLVPGDGKVKTICPHISGGKNWLPGSYNSSNGMLYVPLVESCMDLVPASKIEGATLTTGVTWTLRAQPDSDGKYGRIQAIDVGKQKTVWMARQRAPQTTGVLATSGGVLFAGALDRRFSAYDADTGSRVWQTRLNDIPNGAPMSYMAKGKQYVALVVGAPRPSGQAVQFLALVPEIPLPIESSSAIWVFSLPESQGLSSVHLASESSVIVESTITGFCERESRYRRMVDLRHRCADPKRPLTSGGGKRPRAISSDIHLRV